MLSSSLSDNSIIWKYAVGNKILQGFNREREYIATQGPLPDTVGDFWRLIWDYNIPSVVMLTNLMEKMKVKCSQYWPDSGSQQYANVNVTLINTIQQADFTIRHFQVKLVSFFSQSTMKWDICICKIHK